MTQGIGYVGGALAGLHVITAPASAQRRSGDQPAPAETAPATAECVHAILGYVAD